MWHTIGRGSDNEHKVNIAEVTLVRQYKGEREGYLTEYFIGRECYVTQTPIEGFMKQVEHARQQAVIDAFSANGGEMMDVLATKVAEKIAEMTHIAKPRTTPLLTSPQRKGQ